MTPVGETAPDDRSTRWIESAHGSPTFGDDAAFDERLTRVRRVVWMFLAPALAVAAFTWTAPGSAVPSTVARAALIYVVVLILLRLAGKRTLADISTFDLVILLILSESIQPALTGDDFSITNAIVASVALVAMDVALGAVKSQSPALARWLDDVPTVLVRNGVPVERALQRTRVGIDDIMEAARHQHGLARFSEVQFALLERTGGISIIPRDALPSRHSAPRDGYSDPPSTESTSPVI